MSQPQVPHDPSEPLLTPPQFTLRTLLVVVSLIALLCSLVQWVAPAGLIVLLLLVAVVVCHVAGNAIGTRLRQLGMERARRQPVDERPAAVLARCPAAPAAVADILSASPNYLGQRRRLGWPLPLASGVGCVLGGAGGVLGALERTNGAWLPEVMVVGAVAFGVLGALALFALTALVQVGLGAVRQALATTSAEADRLPRHRSPQSQGTTVAG